MSKIYNKSIILGQATLLILAILASGAMFMPAKAHADTPDDRYAHLDPVVNPSPYISSVKPKSSNTLIVNGSGFIPGSVVKLDGSNRSTTFIDNSHLLVSLSGSDLSPANGFFVTVFNGTPGGGYSNAVSFNISDMPAPANMNSSNNSANTGNTYPDTAQPQNTNTSTSNAKYSALASNSIFGATGFLPSGLIQWILFGIIILLIIIIARKIFGASDKYHNEPLKHA